MLTFLKILFIIGVVAFILFKRKKNKFKNVKNNYSFGLQEAKDCANALQQKKYETVERLLSQCNADNLSVCIDYLALTFDELTLLDWHESSNNKSFSQLVLGAYYNHQAWIVRTNEYAEEVTEADAVGFFEYAEKSIPFYEEACKNNSIAAETHARMIRHYMGTNEMDQVDLHFAKAIALDNNHIWAHVHYAEAIQPKWGGTSEKLNAFIKSYASKPTLLKQILDLKLMVDAGLAEENYFGGTMEELIVNAKILLEATDKEISENPPQSIHKYILFNYLFSLSNELKNTKLGKKYFAKMEGYYTLYPFGIVK